MGGINTGPEVKTLRRRENTRYAIWWGEGGGEVGVRGLFDTIRSWKR